MSITDTLITNSYLLRSNVKNIRNESKITTIAFDTTKLGHTDLFFIDLGSWLCPCFIELCSDNKLSSVLW